MKIGIGIANQGDIKVATMLSLIPATVNCGANVVFIAQKGALLPWIREQIFEIAVSQDCTHLLFVDTDMKFPANTIGKMLELKKGIVGAWTFTKQLPKVPTVHVREESIWRNASVDERPNEPFCRMAGRQVAVGTGLMLIDMEKAARIESPRFKADYHGLGEDIYFCTEALRAGLEVWCDPTIPVKHIGDYEY